MFTLDTAGRRSAATTTATTGSGTTTSGLVRHYTDGSDNPAWTVATDTLGQTTITRYAESIGGDLATTINTDGSAALTVANLHGDVVTTVPITATATSADAAAGISGWSDYTEYGTPRDGATTSTTAGVIGYGWLGAKQRSTTTDTAGLTLMGDRLYNQVTGRFTSLDPEPGGSAWAYGYPTDPINKHDLDGRSWGWAKMAWNSGKNFYARHRTAINIALTVASFAVGGGVLGGAVWAWRAYGIVKAARAGQNAFQATRATSWLAGRMWVGRGGVKGVALNGAKTYSKGSGHAARAWRGSAKKGAFGYSSNLTSSTKGYHNYRSIHINHQSPRRWAPWW